jgi:SPP1 gp7 family putative phage head morphogenesis protein
MSVSRRRSDPEAEADTVAEAAARKDPRLAQIYAVARKHRNALGKRNGDASERMYQGWLAVLQDLRPRIDAITQRIDDARANGEPVNPAWLYQQQRFRELADASRDRFNQYAMLVERETKGLQSYAATEAIDSAYYLMRGALGRTTDPEAPEVLIRPGAEEMKDIVGFLGDGSPLHSLLSTFGDQAAQTIGKALTVGIVTGRSPVEIARSIRQAAGLPLVRAETIARTELHRAFRTATQRTFEKNSDVVSGWIWHSAQQRRTCAACWAMHGTFHPVTETLHGHVRCRCAMLPQTKTWEELGIEGVQGERVTVPLGSDLFTHLSEADQRYILGKTKHDLYKNGDITLADLATLHRNNIWGDSWQESTIAQARQSAQDRLRASQRANRPPRKPKTPKETVAAPTAPDFKPAAQVRAEIETMAATFEKQISAELSEMAIKRFPLEDEWDKIADRKVELIHIGHTRQLTHDEITERTRLSAREQEIADTLDGFTARVIQLQQRRQEGVRQAVLREILYVPEEQTAKFKARGTPRKPGPGATKEQVDRYQRWQDGSEAFRRLIGNGHIDDRTVTYHRATGRAFFRDSDEGIRIDKNDYSWIIVHELGHWVEARSPGFHDAIQKHYDDRTKGETVRKLKDVTGNQAYDDREVTREDKWISVYSGKDYHAMYPGQTIANSELTSMTLQQLYEDPYKMVTKDPETFDLLWRLLRSKNIPPKRRRRTA